ncbi:DoxX family membrane protein [Candidatus Pacearchaeota archaeon]|nr:DoxX family membrane protein [Candidatus Pacearchaeota archaeon]MBI2057279.1 DoxX family membrane protein [Candidatus Pacearchaeota archaeon]
MSFEKLKEESKPLVRYAIGLVFLLFGVDQLMKPALWTAWIPQFIPFEPANMVLINGLFDLAIGIFLILGLFLRPFAAIGIIHLITIIASVGYNDIGIRDFGLLLVLVAVFLQGPDKYCLDILIKKRINK